MRTLHELISETNLKQVGAGAYCVLLDPGEQRLSPLLRDSKMTANCYKCDGTGRINAFSHYAKGVCFACGGQGASTVSPSSDKSLAAQAEIRTGKQVVCPAYGAIYITKHGEGFSASYECGGMVWFNVNNGRITDLIASDYIRDASDRKNALQKLLKTK